MLQIAQGYLDLADMVGRRHDHATAHREPGGEARPQNDS
jgi:hypothetical protein